MPPFDYWQSSRVIPCEQISGVQIPGCAQTTINEFPFWSYLYADLHAHVIDLPIVVLIIGCCASLLLTAKTRPGALAAHGTDTGSGRAGAGHRLVYQHLGCADLCWHWSRWCWRSGRFLWGQPAAGRSIRERLTWPVLRGYAVALGLTLAATYLLFFPFHANYQNFVSGIGTEPVSTDAVPVRHSLRHLALPDRQFPPGRAA